MVLNGGYRGNEGILESINEKKFSATIIIDSVSIKCCKVSLCRVLFHLYAGELSQKEKVSLILSYRWDLWCTKCCAHPPIPNQ